MAMNQSCWKVAAESRIVWIKGKNGSSPKKSGGGGNNASASEKPKCKTCDTKHAGTCNKLKTAPFSSRRDAKSKPNWTWHEKQYVNQMLAQRVSEGTADADLEVKVKEKRPKWTKGLDKGKQMYCMALAQQDNVSNMEDCDEDDMRDYKK